MRHSHMIIYCIIISTLLTQGTSLCFPHVSCETSSGNSVQETVPRRALRTHSSQQHNPSTAKDSDQRQRLIDNAKHSKTEPVKSVDDAIDNDELVYHIDYHGVTTHPAPTPKHPGHS